MGWLLFSQGIGSTLRPPIELPRNAISRFCPVIPTSQFVADPLKCSIGARAGGFSRPDGWPQFEILRRQMSRWKIGCAGWRKRTCEWRRAVSAFSRSTINFCTIITTCRGD